MKASDVSRAGIAVLGSTLELNGGTMVAQEDSSTDAALTHAGLANDPGHKVSHSIVETTRPTPRVAEVTRRTLAVGFSEYLDVVSAPPGSAFTVTATSPGGSTRTIRGTGTAAVSGGTLTVELAGSVAPGEAVTLQYARSAGGRVRDARGNEARGFSGQQMSNGTPAGPRLVSNTAQKSVILDPAAPFDNSVAEFGVHLSQAFTTGSYSSGYRLTSIEIHMARAYRSSLNYTLSIRTPDDDGKPGDTVVGTLTGPAELAVGLNAFTAAGDGIQLAASTTYFAVLTVHNIYVENFRDIAISLTLSDDEDAGGTAGFSIADGRWIKVPYAVNQIWERVVATGSVWKMAINGAEERSTALIKNTGQTASASSSDASFSNDHAQWFRTGSHSGGYRLTRLELGTNIGTPANTTAPTYSVSIRNPATNDSQNPGTLAGDLENPDALAAGGLNTFAASGVGIKLAASTTYFAVLDVSAAGDKAVQIQRANTNFVDSGGAAGWTTSHTSRRRVNSATDWSGVVDDTNELKFAVYGHGVGPGFQSATVTGDQLVVTFAGNLGTGTTVSGTVFDVTATKPDGTSRGIGGTGNVTISGATATVTLASAVTWDETVTLSYSPPAAGALGDGSGNWVDPFSDQSLTNFTPGPVLVSNTGQTAASGSLLVGGNLEWVQAQTFTTGDDTAGYTLSAVDVELASGTPSANFSVRIYTTTGSPPAPDSSLHVLNNPTSLTANATNTFSADKGATLTGNTTYAVVFQPTGQDSTNLAKTTSNAEDSGAASGWSIGDTRHRRQGTDAWSETTDAQKPMIAIRGTGKTPPPMVTPPPLVDPPPPTQDPQQPQDPSEDSEQRPPPPKPLQLALWTDRPAYRAGESVRLYRTLDPHDDEARYHTFVYLERAGGEEGEEAEGVEGVEGVEEAEGVEEGKERSYLSPLSAVAELHADPVNDRGMPEDLAKAWRLTPADRELIFEGPVPEPGLWQFVLELRPGGPMEQDRGFEEPLRTRRAWTKFVVAEGGQLLNRRGFTREVKTELTLRADKIYYLLHQMFVRDGATLTIEPGTFLQAFGPQTAIIVEPGGQIVAEGTREAPVVLTCVDPVGQRKPGCWGGLRLLGRAPVTRLEGSVPGVLPAERAVYGGTDAEDSSGVLRYVRVEFAGAASEPEASAPAIGLYGAGSGTVLDHVQARASGGDGIAFSGGTAICSHCIASASSGAGLSWERGWQGTGSHVYVQHGREGGDGLAGAHDPEGHDREPRSHPTLSNVTLVHAAPYGQNARKAVAVQLSTGSAIRAYDLVATHFGGGAIEASGRSRLLFLDGESSVYGALLWLNGAPQVPRGFADAVEFSASNPELRDVRDFANPDPRPKTSLSVVNYVLDVEAYNRAGYIGAFHWEENWLDEWTVFGPESLYDLRERGEDGN